MFAAKGALAATVLKFQVPGLDQLVIKSAPIVASPKAYEAIYKLDLLSAVGSAIFLTALISMALLRMQPRAGLVALAQTVAE
ncbi:L-lactate permease [Oxalobacteraceae bacterium GrIS 1.11]